MTALFLISGGSRGLGFALAEQATQAGADVVSFARTPGGVGEHVACDLADPDTLPAVVRQALIQRDLSRYDQVVLINNAGMLDPIRRQYTSAEATLNLTVNLSAQIVLTQAVLNAIEPLPVNKQVVFISSGAARRAYHGWSLYCTAKAGLEHYSRCIALEQSSVNYPTQVVTINPGVMDTSMQTLIRRTDKADFPSRDKFDQLHADAALPEPEQVARYVLLGVERKQDFAGETLLAADFAGHSVD